MELSILSACDLKNVNWRYGRLRPYAVVRDDTEHTVSRRFDPGGDTNPDRDEKLTIPVGTLQDVELSLEIVQEKSSELTKQLIASVGVQSSQALEEIRFHGSLERMLKLNRLTGSAQEVGNFQIFVKMPSRKTSLLWVCDEDTGETLKTLLVQKEGYSSTLFYILHEGKVLHEGETLRDCQISKNSTLHVMYRLRGGTVENRGTTGPSSYKDAARSKGSQSTAAPPSKPYIVEKLDAIPSLEIKNTEVTQLFSSLQTHALICRFNGFWPRSFDLHKLDNKLSNSFMFQRIFCCTV